MYSNFEIDGMYTHTHAHTYTHTHIHTHTHTRAHTHTHTHTHAHISMQTLTLSILVCLCVQVSYLLASSPGSLAHSRGGGVRRERAWFQPFAHARNFPRNLGNRVILVFFRVWIMHNRVISVFFRVMAICSDSDNKFLSALVLRMIYTDEGYSDWKPGRNNRVVIVLLLLRD